MEDDCKQTEEDSIVMDDSKEFKIKLHELYNNKGITKRLRTHLRQLILSELHNSNVDKKYPVISIKSRAIGSLIVEWLQLHGCHYTLSVLSSEIPSLADLPMLANEGSQNKLQVDEANDVLKSLGLCNEEIINEYTKYDLSLIVCILKIASAWKSRLEFKELPRSPRFPNEKEPVWCERLRDITAETSTPPEQLPTLYSSLHNLIQAEVEECISQERRSLFDELLLRENSIKDKLKEQEASILSKLLEVKQGFSIKRDKVEEDLFEKRNLLSKLMEEVQCQHQAVINGLSELKMKEQRLEDDKKTWRKIKERENSRLKEKAKGMLEQELEIDRKLKELTLKENDLRDKLAQKSVVTQGTCTTIRLSDDKAVNTLPKKLDHEDKISRPLLSKQKTIGKEKLNADDASLENIAISTPTTSESSSITLNETDETKGATFRRIKELREETLSTRGDFLESRRLVFDSDSSSSDSECSPNLLRLRRREDGPSTLLNRPQVTVPYLREGCHSAGTSQIFPSSSRFDSNRYKNLLSHGDQNLNPLPSRLFIDKADSVFSEHCDRDATIKLREQSKILDNLIQAARRNAPVSNQSNSEYEKRKQIRNTKKISSLMEGVRTIPNEVENASSMSEREKRHCEIIQEETNMLGAGEAVDSNETILKPSHGTDPISSASNELVVLSENYKVGHTEEAKLISISPYGSSTKKEQIPTFLQGGKPSLIQAVLENDSDVSEGEIISIGRPSVSSDNFWS